MDASDLDLVLLVAAALLVAGVAAVRVATRGGFPTLLLYLAIGLAIGEAGAGLRFDDATLAMVLGSAALGVILAEGGLTTRWSVIRPVLGVSVVLATVGVLVSVAVTAGLSYALLGVDLRTAIILGAVVSSTDAAAVFSVLRRLPLRGRTRATLEAESGLNDPPVIILVTVVTSDAWDRANVITIGGVVLYQLVAGALIGLAVARAGQAVLARSALPATGLYPVATVAIAMLAFALAGVAGASPFLAVYLAGMWLGNARLPHRQATRGFVEALAWLAQIGLFIMLGLLASPARLVDAVVPALVVGGTLLLVARPLSVVLCTAPFRMPWREQAFVSWAGLRGAVPVVLATIPITVGIPAAQRIFDVVFLLVVVFTLVQAPVLPYLARRLGLDDDAQTTDVQLESAPLDGMDAAVIQLVVPAASRLPGVSVLELRLPGDAVVALVQRDDHLLVPSPTTVLRAGDHLMIATPDQHRAAVEQRLVAVGAGGRLARWLGDTTSGRAATVRAARPGRWWRAARRSVDGPGRVVEVTASASADSRTEEPEIVNLTR